MQNHQELIRQALDHIQKEQSPDGSFVSLSGFSPTDFSDAIPHRTTFFTSNILTCLQGVRQRTADVQNRGAKFLLSQKSSQWSFNYWARDANGKIDPSYPPYPDDLDDTFAALTALQHYNPAIIDGHALSSIAKMLTAREVREGGPYRTWLVGNNVPAKWQDTDPVVNSTIGYFLALIGVRLPALGRFLDEAVHKDRLVSPYYPGIFHVGYFLSRFYKSNSTAGNTAIRKALADIIAGHLRDYDDKKITTLELAMAISTLSNIGHRALITDTSVHALIARVANEGFMPYAFCIDPAREGRRCYAGSSALTAAFCAEALSYHNDVVESFLIITPQPLPLHEHIRFLARSACNTIGESLRETAIAQIDTTNDKRVTALAYDFREMMYHNGVIVSADITEQLSLANLYGWMAYKIYDDVLDADADHDPSLIPCANFFLRALAEIYSTLAVRNPEVAHLFHATMNCVDNANAWEQNYCHAPSTPSFGDHQTLADRSIGHAMGPLAELLFAGYGPDSGEYKNVESFFRHYLIARQIHDDAHDWTEDLMRGRVNCVGTLVLARFKEEYRRDDMAPPIVAAMPALRAMFWKTIVDDAASMITAHVDEARRARQRSSILDGSDFLESDLRTLESGARRALKERDKAMIFLDDYRATPSSSAV